jgi:AsmA-like C-terminal region
VQDGVATTRNFAMRGVSANVSIDGSADLARETQNLHVRVLPQLNLGTGSIAYALLVNPVIGLGTLAIGEVLRDPLSKVLAFEYNVTGPWAEPAIVRLDRTGFAPLIPPAAPAVPASPIAPIVPAAPLSTPASPATPAAPEGGPGTGVEPVAPPATSG